jgi:acetyltransferase
LLVRAKDGYAGHRRADEIIRLARDNRRIILTEFESKEILAAYGIPVVTAFPAATESEALAVAEKIGYPVALKLHSETITHKSEVGGVCLNLRDADEVRGAWKKIHRAVAGQVGEKHFLGVTVERMVIAEGFELILGSSVDPQFGPVLLFGAGGRWVEAMQDRAIGLPPLTSTLARRLMEQTRIYSGLKAIRGRAPIDLNAVEHTLVRFSQLVAEQRWIKEIDVNPLFVSADQIVALDARVILQDPSVTEDRLPALAIRPYPLHYATTCALNDGTPIELRSIRPEDEPMMVNFHETLSDQSVYYRYFSAMSLTQRTNHARLARLCFIDYDREVALVAVHDGAASGEPEIIGVGRLCKAHGKNEAEFAVVVSDCWQRRGLGTRLLRRLVEIGREEHLARITGTVLTENHGMCRVCEHAGFKLRARAGEPEIQATIAL